MNPEPTFTPTLDAPVQIDRHTGWAELTLNRPAQRNAIDLAMARALGDAIANLEADDGVQVVVLRGAAGAFSSGLDLKAIQAHPDPAGVSFAELWLRVHQGLMTSGKVWIVALERHAINGAAALAIAGDWLVCGESAFLQIAEIKLGMAAPRNVAWLALRHSEAVAARLCLLGDRVGAAELLRLGIATEVRPDDAVVARARELAQTVSAYPASGIAAVKRGLRAAHTRRAPGEWFDACTPTEAQP